MRLPSAPAVLAALAALALAAGPAAGAAPLFRAHFPRTGLVTNEYAYWNPGDPLARRSRAWEMTSGSLFARQHAGWSGVPDDCEPNRLSTNCTDSAIFRLTTRRSNFGNVRVQFGLRPERLVDVVGDDGFDGVSIWLRYRHQEGPLYKLSVFRRDGRLAVQKKCRGGGTNGGTYYTLAERSTRRAGLGAWTGVGASARNRADGSVRLKVWVAGRTPLFATDRGRGCAPFRRAGKVGIRGDDTQFRFRSFAVWRAA